MRTPSTLKVILLRHAARSAHGLGDTSLNAIGQRQAQELTGLLAPQGPLPIPTDLITSPKKRARETLQPLSAAVSLDLKIDARLDERHQNETGAEFKTRVAQALSELGAQAKADVLKPGTREATIYLCSHLDWLEIAMLLAPSDSRLDEDAANWSNAEYRIFRIAKDGLWTLTGHGVATGRSERGN